MKRNFAIAVAAAALLLGSAVPLWAQWNALAGAAWQDFANGLPNGQRFQNFVQTHPGVGRELQSNPNLLWDPAWRRNHPAVGQWIYHHQPLWHNMVARQAGMYPSTFGNFASNRPGLMNDLNENPGLAEDQGYLRQHPDFADFMRNHPGFQQDMRDRAQYWRNHHSYPRMAMASCVERRRCAALDAAGSDAFKRPRLRMVQASWSRRMERRPRPARRTRLGARTRSRMGPRA